MEIRGLRGEIKEEKRITVQCTYIFPEPSDYAYISHKHILLSILIEQ
jgi:hypothetical protein